jgi:hypothetical protein
MLPPSSDDDSSDDLSPIEEERSSSSNSGASDSSHSKYVSSFLGSSTPSVSSESSSEISSYKNLHEEYGTPTDHEFSDIEINTDSSSSNHSVKSIKSLKSSRVLRHFQTANMNYDEIEVDVQHQEGEQYTKTHNDPSNKQETVVESVTVIQHMAEVHGEFSQDTLVEVDEEVPFEAVLNGFSERFRDDGNSSHRSTVSCVLMDIKKSSND